MRICNPGCSSLKAAAERGYPRCHESGFPHPFAGREGGEDWGTGGTGGEEVSRGFFFSPQLGRTRGRTCQIRWLSHAEVGLTLTVCMGSGHGARSVLGSYRLLPGPSLPPPQHVTTLLPRAPRQGLFADPERCSLGFAWENIPSFVHKDCQCLRACVRLCAGGRGSGGGTSCSIHQNARIVFSHGGAASRACRGRHGAKARARSARTASSDQYGLMPFF